VLAVTDAAVLAPRADGVLVVASQRQTHKGGLARATAMLGGPQTRVLGLAFNKVDNKSRSSYGYGHYGQGYYGDPEPEDRSRIPWRATKARVSKVEAAR
jgi:Mrp family chromosome partitioning ATPase